MGVGVHEADGDAAYAELCHPAPHVGRLDGIEGDDDVPTGVP
jgi:hypothetical protein